jgi:hypothetical protein
MVNASRCHQDPVGKMVKMAMVTIILSKVEQAGCSVNKLTLIIVSGNVPSYKRYTWRHTRCSAEKHSILQVVHTCSADA